MGPWKLMNANVESMAYGWAMVMMMMMMGPEPMGGFWGSTVNFYVFFVVRSATTVLGAKLAHFGK